MGFFFDWLISPGRDPTPLPYLMPCFKRAYYPDQGDLFSMYSTLLLKLIFLGRDDLVGEREKWRVGSSSSDELGPE